MLCWSLGLTYRLLETLRSDYQDSIETLLSVQNVVL